MNMNENEIREAWECILIVLIIYRLINTALSKGFEANVLLPMHVCRLVCVSVSGGWGNTRN